jgi:PilZ domain
MQKFEYRTPRYPVDLPVQLTVADACIAGRCRAISKEGMTVEFRGTVAEDACGTVSVSYRNLSLDLRVCVTHHGERVDGLKFLFEAEPDRTAVERLVALVAASTGQAGPMLVR